MKITIFGLAGSGTSTAGKLLSEKLNYTFMSSGNIMRTWVEELGYTLYEFENKIIKDDDSFDIKLDKKVADFGKENNNFVFESRLAWNFIPDSFKIYLKCGELERYNRIQKREGLLLEDITEKNKIRETELEQRYAKIYPDIQFPPNENVFDLVIDGENASPDEVMNIIMSKLR